MEDRTVNIIMLTKRCCGLEQTKKAIALYMSEECNCPVSTYTESVLYSIVKTAFFDYMWCAGHERYIATLREMIETNFADKMIDRMLLALGMTRVADTGKLYMKHNGDWDNGVEVLKYIDGFHSTPFSNQLDDQDYLHDFLKRTEEVYGSDIDSEV